MIEPAKTKPHFIAYLDVLGYSDHLKDNEEDDSALLQAVDQLARIATSLSSDALLHRGGFKTKTFSDNVLLAIELDQIDPQGQRLNQLVFLAGLLQYIMLRTHGLLMRGCITCGNLYVDESLVFGKGLIDAVEGEKRARHPRVIIEKTARALDEEALKSLTFVKPDNDKVLYVDYFQYDNLELADQNGSTDVPFVLAGINAHLKTRVKKYCSFPGGMKDPKSIAAKESVIAKHLWVIEKYNNHCQQTGYSEFKINYYPSLNKRLMKFELKLIEE